MVRKVLVSVAAVSVSLLLLVGFAQAVRADPEVPPVLPEGVSPAEVTGTCEDGYQASGAVYRICMPSPRSFWNGKLVVYAHGYVPFYRPVEIPESQMRLPGALLSVDEMVTLLGYAFAASSYYTNGLAVLPALSDLVDLVDLFAQEETTPTEVLLAGVSEGGLITALAVEQHPDVFDGGLAMCGPYGSFKLQADYLGHTRVVFDYFFPGLMPGSPVSIPTTLIDTWETSYYTATILPVLENPVNAVSITQILQVVGIPPYEFDPPDSTTALERLLWYSVYATNDAKAKLGGQPFGNMTYVYRGSQDDAALNAGVQRFAADAIAVATLERDYNPTGVLTVPLVMMHTTGDALVPYWQVPLYRAHTIRADNIALHYPIEVDRFGHCSFTSEEVFEAFDQLEAMVADPPVYRPISRVLLPLAVRIQ